MPRLVLMSLIRRKAPVNRVLMKKAQVKRELTKRIRLKKNLMLRMIVVFRFHSITRMMHFMLVRYMSVLHRVSQQKSFLIQVLNTSL
jgi:hypothetical protein